MYGSVRHLVLLPIKLFILNWIGHCKNRIREESKFRVAQKDIWTGINYHRAYYQWLLKTLQFVMFLTHLKNLTACMKLFEWNTVVSGTPRLQLVLGSYFDFVDAIAYALFIRIRKWKLHTRCEMTSLSCLNYEPTAIQTQQIKRYVFVFNFQ